MEIKVLGPGCSKCNVMAANVERALADLGIEGEVIKVTKMDEILSFDILMTPGLVIGGKVKASGRVPGKEEIKAWIQEELGAGK